MLRVVGSGVVYRGGLIAGCGLCENGDLVLSFNNGGDLSPGQRGGVLRSRDGGKSWGEPETWFESVYQRGGVEMGCSLTRLSSGRLLLPYADGFYLDPTRKKLERNALLFCPVSDDCGKTWRSRKAQSFAGYEAFAFGRVIEVSGKLLMPVWGSYDVRGTWGAGLVQSRDGGETWTDWRSIVRGAGDETPIVALADGRVLALIRGYTPDLKQPYKERPFHVAWSKDGGESFSAPQSVNLRGTSPSLHISPKGRLLAGYRSTLPGANCHVASSPDGGASWSFDLELSLPGGAWKSGGYPVLTNLKDGRMLATFHNRDVSAANEAYWQIYWNLLEEA
ncbi:MAG: exo-alpha-sialidase [Acidobacteria bacterium]|nr:exo-alpha-sialidase [Acidobacteriota bacterium]